MIACMHSSYSTEHCSFIVVYSLITPSYPEVPEESQCLQGNTGLFVVKTRMQQKTDKHILRSLTNCIHFQYMGSFQYICGRLNIERINFLLKFESNLAVLEKFTNNQCFEMLLLQCHCGYSAVYLFAKRKFFARQHPVKEDILNAVKPREKPDSSIGSTYIWPDYCLQGLTCNQRISVYIEKTNL